MKAYRQCAFRTTRSDAYVRRTVSTRISHLVRERRTSWLGAEIDAEIVVERQSAFIRVHVHLDHRSTIPVTQFSSESSRPMRPSQTD